MIKHKIKLLHKSIIFFIIIFITLFIAVRYLEKALSQSDYFRIKEVVTNKPGEGTDFSYLEGRNIFGIDSKKESGRISELYPAYKSVRLIKVLPNRLFISFVDRKPLAYVKLYRYFYLDDDLVLFDVPKATLEPSLPLITGLEAKIPGPKAGKQYNIKEAAAALNIIKAVKINNLLKDYRIKRIDVISPNNISCFMLKPLPPPDYPKAKNMAEYQGIEVKIGQDNINDKIRILAGLIFQLKDELNNIKYIDLRFKEPVIRFKDVK